MSKSTLVKHSLSHQGALRVLQADMNEAESLSVAQNMAIADDDGNLITFVLIDGTKRLSRETTISKTITAASNRQATGQFNPTIQIELIVATGGHLTNIEGGQPLIVADYCVGGTGIDSCPGQQNIAVANDGAAALITEEPELCNP